MDCDFQVLAFDGHKSQIWLLGDTCKRFWVINLKLGTDNLVSGQMSTDFGVAILNYVVPGCKMVKIHFWLDNSKMI